MERFKRKYEELYIACENKTNIMVLKKISHYICPCSVSVCASLPSGLCCWSGWALWRRVLSRGKPEKGQGGAFVPGKGCLPTPQAGGILGEKKQNFRPTEEKIANSILLTGNGIIHFPFVISRITLFTFLKS